jgi:excisionase family DNA binding protein
MLRHIEGIKDLTMSNRTWEVDGHMKQEALEPYVSPEEAAVFLKIKRLKLIRMARSGSVPAHPLGTGKRRQWRFKLSELDKHMQHGIDIARLPVRQRKEHQ